MNNNSRRKLKLLDEEEVFGKPLRDPILGKHFKLPGQSAVEKPVQLDLTSLPSYTPVYAHLKIHELEPLRRPSTPPAIKRIEEEDFMDFYTSKKANTEVNSKEVSTVTSRDQKSQKLQRN